MRVLKVSASWWVRILAQVVVRLHNFVLKRVKYEDMGEMPLNGLGLPDPAEIPLVPPKNETFH